MKLLLAAKNEVSLEMSYAPSYTVKLPIQPGPPRECAGPGAIFFLWGPYDVIGVFI